MKQAIRNSNIELLRIVCMLMVVVLHFNNNGANTGIVKDNNISSGTWYYNDSKGRMCVSLTGKGSFGESTKTSTGC